MMITENNYTKGGAEGLKNIFLSDSFTGYLGEGKKLLPGGRYRPLSQALFNIYYSLFGEKPYGLHLLNIFIFIISALLLFKNLRNLFECNKNKLLTIAFLTAFLYVIHPLNTEVVANIKSLDLLLAMLFSMISLHYSISFQRTNYWLYLVGMGFSFFLGILSKETAITSFAIIPVSLLFFKNTNVKVLISIVSVLTIALIFYIISRAYILGDTLNITVYELLNNPFLEATTTEKYATIFYTWLIYLKLIFIPYPLTHDYYPYVIELHSFQNPLVLLSILIYISTSIYAIYKLVTKASINQLFKVNTNAKKENERGASLTTVSDNRKFYYAYGIIFYLTVFSISSNLLFNIGTFMNERFIYIADIGIFIIISKWLTDLYKNKKYRVFVILILSILFISFSLLTIKRNPVWKNDFTLFRNDVQISVNSAKCTVSAGGKTYEAALLEKNKITKTKLLNEAKIWVSKGVKIHPKYFQGWMLLGNINLELSDFQNSLICYQNCLALSPRNNDILSNIRNVVIKSREANQLQISDKAISILVENNYQKINTLFLKSLNLEKENLIDSCIYVLQNILSMDSINADAFNKLGQIAGQYKNDMQTAELFLLKAYELKPTNASILENLGTLYAYKNDLSKALYFFKASYKSDPKNRQIYTNIIMVYKGLGQIKNAMEWEEKLKQNFN